MRRIVNALVAVALVSAPVFGQSGATAPSFDIADVHAGTRNPGVGMTGGLLREGRYELHNATMVDLVRTAYGVDAELREMLKALLIERFKMKTHVEDRPVSGYVLSAEKPRLTKADPSSRTKCIEGPATATAADPRNRNPILSRLITCQNTTMAQFAERLMYTANGYVRVPALDATGLEGGWNFSVNFSPIGAIQGGRGGGDGAGPVAPPAAGALTASDPNGAISLPEALDKQLGLKLELKKRPLPALVIDHIEEKPLEN